MFIIIIDNNSETHHLYNHIITWIIYQGIVMSVSIDMQAPDFTSMTTFRPLKLSDYKGQLVILFSHPGDFALHIVGKFISKWEWSKKMF